MYTKSELDCAMEHANKKTEEILKKMNENPELPEDEASALCNEASDAIKSFESMCLACCAEIGFADEADGEGYGAFRIVAEVFHLNHSAYNSAVANMREIYCHIDLGPVYI